MPRRRKSQKTTKRRKQQKQEEEEEIFWEIRGILDERVVNGNVEYLVDWVNDPVTGVSYPPSWSEGVTDEALKEWEEGKRNAQLNTQEQEETTASQEFVEQEVVPPETTTAPEPTPVEPVVPENTDQSGDAPPRPANFRRLQRVSSRPRSRSPTPSERPQKKRRITKRGEQSTEAPVSSIAYTTSDDSITESPASIRTQDLDKVKGQKIIIEIEKESGFDPTDYFSVINTQSSNQVSELEQEDDRVAVSEPSQRTIPDSQDLSGDFSTQSREQPSSKENAHIPCHTVPDSQDLSLVDLDIPSHQINFQRAQSSAESRLSPSSLSRSLQADRLSSVPPTRPSDLEEQACSVPAFLSQFPPQADPTVPESSLTSGALSATQGTIDLPAPQSSQGDRDQDTSDQVISELFTNDSNSGQAASQTQDLGQPDLAEPHTLAETNSGESQAAQVVDRGFGPFTSGLSASQDTQPQHNLTAAASPERPLPTYPPSKKRSPRFQSFLDSLMQIGHPRTTPSNPSSIVMSAESEPQSAPQHSRSVVDLMRELVDLGAVEHFSPESEGEHAAPEDQLPGSAELGGESSHLSEPWKNDSITQSEMQPQSISPASIMNNPNVSARDQLREIINQSWGSPSQPNPVNNSLIPEPMPEEHPTTISLADISRSTELEDPSQPLMPFHDTVEPSFLVGQSSEQSITMAQVNPSQGFGDSSLLPPQEFTSPYIHFVTLPFQASIRPAYRSVLFEHRKDAAEFNRIFSSEVYTEPSKALVDSMDDFFGQLLNICDYPQDLIGTKLGELPPAEKTKYACDANSKFNFVYELLQGLERDTEVIIVARSLELLRLLFALTEALRIECVCEALGVTESKFQNTAARVTLTYPNGEHDPFNFEVVIGFDYSFGGSSIIKKLSTNQVDRKPPLILHLVLTHSIEHIDLFVPQELSHLERKTALLTGVAQAQSLVDSPIASFGEPHEIAETFTCFLNGFTDSLVWEPQPIPDEVLDFFASSQNLDNAQMPPGNGLKRKLDTEEDEDEAKRIRVLPLRDPMTEAKRPPLPDIVQDLLKLSTPLALTPKSEDIQVTLSVASLETLAEKLAKYKHQASEASELEVLYKSTIDRLEKQVKNFSRTASKQSNALRDALKDRAVFEKMKRKSEEAAAKAAESAQRENDKAQKRIAELEATVHRLTEATNGSTAESPLSQSEKVVKELSDKVQHLEKRLSNAHRDRDYVQGLYQDSNTRFGVLESELKELRVRSAELEKSASENIVQIHSIHAQNTIKEYLHMVNEQKTQIREREIELDCLRDEVRSLRNGRRETRGGSVPRSPRMGVMSPRLGTARFSGSASRGTSPIPAPSSDGPGPSMPFIGQQGNGRWGHLRD